MLPGAGVFTITLPVETTKAGQFDAQQFEYDLHTRRSKPCSTADTSFVRSISNPIRGHNRMANLSEFGSDIQEFQVFRMDSSTPFDYSSPYDIVTGQNFYSDSNVDVGSTYGYVVRSIHTFGVVSNLSQPFEVTIPNPPCSCSSDKRPIDRS